MAILSTINNEVLKIIPGAKVSLFGSRAYGNPTTESDWDILILTRQPVNASHKKAIHNILFPVSVTLGAFINTLIISENEWTHNLSYYSLHQTVNKGMLHA